MRWSERRAGDVAIVDVKSRLTIDSREEFRQIIERLLLEGQRKILVCFEKTAVTDRHGAEELVACFDEASGIGAVIKLVNLQRCMDGGVLLFADLISRFENYADEAEALASFGGQELSGDHQPRSQ
jgi:anti-anti-sigma regulatory factor